MGLRPGSSLSSTCSEAGNISAFCRVPDHPSWVLWVGEAEGAANPHGKLVVAARRRADKRTRTAHPCSSYGCAVTYAASYHPVRKGA